MDAESLKQQLEFYRDLGFREVYLRAPDTAEAATDQPSPVAEPGSSCTVATSSSAAKIAG